MQSEYDAIVIGSGFGGAVSACRLAQAGLKVGVLERGRRYDRDFNLFPRNWNNPLDGWLWRHHQGLFDVRPFQEMTVVQCAGFGGGSLIYANVHLRAPAEVFLQPGWPQVYRRETLDPYYDLVAYMLDINPITKSAHKGMPPKASLMQQVAAQLGRSEQFCFPNIAVDFFTPDEVHPNKFGALQKGCTYCGECDIGCNRHAKNTLDLNYLKIAQDHRAEITTQCEVVSIAESPEGYLVRYTDHAAGSRAGETRAKYVFVCGGAVNSTELLLKCRNVDRTLPRISARLGSDYSGNGDFLAFAFNTDPPFKPSEGPTITTGIVYDRNDGGFHKWFILQEGGYPKEIGAVLQLLNPRRNLFREAEILTRDAFHSAFGSLAAEVSGFPDPESEKSAVFLAMGRDLANGVIGLDPLTHGLRIVWDTKSNTPLYQAEERLCADVARAMNGDPAVNPLWRLFRLPVSVHNLGGCPMGANADEGVTDPNGEVHGYRNLFVLDGAILPSATGVNPSHTIAAVTERNIQLAIRRITGKADWRPPEAEHAVPIVDPLAGVTIPAGGTLPGSGG